jgi:hypothetical protein
MDLSLMPTSVRAPVIAPAAAHGQAGKRIQEDQADQRSPEAAAHRTRGRQVHSLMQSHLSLLILDATTASSRSMR